MKGSDAIRAILRRLRRPGYWIVALILLSWWAYHLHQEHQRRRHQEALLAAYRAYATDLIGELRRGEFEKVQSRFGERGRQIDLESIVLFVDTLHLSRTKVTKWSGVEEHNGTLRLRGTIRSEDNATRSIDLFVVRRRNRILLKRLRIDGQILEPETVDFPLNLEAEENGTKTIERSDHNKTRR